MRLDHNSTQARHIGHSSTSPDPEWHSAPRPAILAIGTALPPYKLDQRALGKWMAAAFADRPRLARLIEHLHAASGIETRYSCVPDYGRPATESAFAPGQSKLPAPTTGERMAIYAREAVPIGLDAAQTALTNFARGRNLALTQATRAITHLVVASCTGFFAPGLDFALAQALGLAPTVNRTLIGFMGCAAMLNALRVAHEAVAADASACVLVVSVELCSLHSQPANVSRDQLVAASLFGDGASACVVSQPAEQDRNYFQLEQFVSVTKPNTDQEMVWTIGDHGFELHLSPRIPDHLAEAAPSSLAQLFGGVRPAFWAIHPGGPAILDRLADIFAVGAAQMQPSRTVLRRVGNLSSATLLFVLDEVRTRLQQSTAMEDALSAPQLGVAMAFGPGLVIEMARLSFVPAMRGAMTAAHGRPARVAVYNP